MIAAIKRIFGIQEKTVWSYEPRELAELPVGTVIIENGGRTEGGPATEWTKGYTGTWSNSPEFLSSIVSDSYFQMPFAVVREVSADH